MVAVTLNLSKELNHLRKGLINIQDSDDTRCLKWCLVRYLNPADPNTATIRKTDKGFARKLVCF